MVGWRHPRSSKPVRGRSAVLGRFDSCALPPLAAVGALADVEIRELLATGCAASRRSRPVDERSARAFCDEAARVAERAAHDVAPAEARA